MAGTTKKTAETETVPEVDAMADYLETLEARSYRGKPTHQKDFALGVAKRAELDKKKGATK